MRIIAGTARGRRLQAPAGSLTRPTTDRVRESLMSSVISARGGLDGAVVLDAFGGSAALSLECLSRGAAFAVICDTSRDACAAINANIAACGFKDRTRLVSCDITKRVPSCAQGAYDLVFLDPPYAMGARDALGVVAKASQHNLLASPVLVIYEHKLGNEEAADEVAATLGLSLVRRKTFGETVVDMFRKG